MNVGTTPVVAVWSVGSAGAGTPASGSAVSGSSSCESAGYLRAPFSKHPGTLEPERRPCRTSPRGNGSFETGEFNPGKANPLSGIRPHCLEMRYCPTGNMSVERYRSIPRLTAPVAIDCGSRRRPNRIVAGKRIAHSYSRSKHRAFDGVGRGPARHDSKEDSGTSQCCWKMAGARPSASAWEGPIAAGRLTTRTARNPTRVQCPCGYVLLLSAPWQRRAVRTPGQRVRR
jgi:hypothetical protein